MSMLYNNILSLGFLLIVVVLSIHHTSRRRKKATTSRPPSYPIIGCLVSFYKNRNQLLDWYTNLLSQSSPIKTIVVRRLGARPTIVTADPANVEHILRANFGNYPKGRAFTDIVGDFLGDGIFSVDGELWSSQRKLASHEFSTKTLREFVVGTLEAEVQNRLLPLLHHCTLPPPHDNNASPTVLDLQEILGRLAFDTICQVSLGMDPCCLDLSRPLPSLVTSFDVASKTCAMRGAAPISLIWKLKRALNIGSERHLATAVKQVHEAVSQIIQTKIIQLQQKTHDDGGDLLTRLLVAGHDQDLVRDMVISFIMAGRDTTSAAMTWLFWLLSYHPEIEKNIVKEVDALVSSNNKKELDFEVLKNMEYLKACLCESMRLYPPVAWDSKHAAADDVLPDGTPVRKGDRVTYFPYGMGRMVDLWGEDRLQFKPERWFNKDGGGFKAVSPFKFPVFQAGPRVCLGKEMAFIQMKYVVASILMRFEIRPASDKHPIFVPLLTAHMAGGFNVLIRPRTRNP